MAIKRKPTRAKNAKPARPKATQASSKPAAKKKAPARKASAAKLTARKAARKAPAKKTAPKKTAPKKAARATRAAKKAAKKTTKKVAAKKVAAKKSAAAKKTTASKGKTAGGKAKAASGKAKVTGKPAAGKAKKPRAKRPEDLSWLDAYPALAALRDDEVSRRFNLRWHGQREAEKEGREMTSYYGSSWHLGMLWSEDLWEGCREVVTGLLKVADGPAFCRREMLEEPCALYLHPDRPDELLLAFSHKFPALLWIPFAATAAGLEATLGAFWPEQRVPRRSLSRELRVFLGYMRTQRVPNPYTGELEEAGPHELARHWTSSSAMDPQSWGTAYDDDPWDERRGTPAIGELLARLNLSREYNQQEDGAVSTLTHRTTFSRSHLGIEIHRRALYVAVLRYRPNPFPQVVRRFNERCQSHYPEDLPIDLVASLYGFQFLTADKLSAALEEQTEDGARAAYLEALAAVRHPDLSVTEELRRWAAHPSLEVRAAVVNAALQYNWHFLIEDMAAQEQPGDLGEFLHSVLLDGIAPPQYNEHGEPDWMNESEEDESEEDESEEEGGE